MEQKYQPPFSTLQIFNMKNFTIVEVNPDHAKIVMDMINKIAEFEKMLDCVKNTAEKLKCDIENKAVHGFIAFDGEEVAGMMIFYYAYASLVGQVIHMEDLFIGPQFRRMGLARALWKRVAQTARDQDITYLRYVILDWNKGANALSSTMDYVDLTETMGWHTLAMDEPAIKKFANE